MLYKETSRLWFWEMGINNARSNCFKFAFVHSNLSRHITLGRSLRFPYHDIEADVVREGAPLHAVGAEHDYPRYKSWIKIRSEKLFKIVSIVLSSRVCVLIGMNWIFGNFLKVQYPTGHLPVFPLSAGYQIQYTAFARYSVYAKGRRTGGRISCKIHTRSNPIKRVA